MDLCDHYVFYKLLCDLSNRGVSTQYLTSYGKVIIQELASQLYRTENPILSCFSPLVAIRYSGCVTLDALLVKVRLV